MGFHLRRKEEGLVQRYVTRLDDLEAPPEEARVVAPLKRESRRRRPIEVLTIAQGVVIVSLLSWLVTGYRTVPSARAWLMGNMIIAGVLWVPLIVPLLAGMLIGGTIVYAMEHRLSREQRILENLLELIE